MWRRVLVLVGALALTGCSALAPAADPTPAASTPSPAPAPSDGPGASATVTPAGTPLATRTIDLDAGYGRGTLTISVVGLAVRGRLTTLQLELRPEGDLGAGDRINQVLGTPDGARAFAPELVDPVNLKAYSEADGGLSITDGLDVHLGDGRITTIDFAFAAPQDDVATLDVVLGSGLPTFRDVPVER